ncbi:MAG: DUF5652 family protein [Candidatus Levyibacteriota bacterium]
MYFSPPPNVSRYGSYKPIFTFLLYQLLTMFESMCYDKKMNAGNLSAISPTLLYALFIWSLLWKGVALWKSARDSQRNWFLAILILNTVGILELVYLFFFAKNKLTLKDLLFWKKFKKK